MQLFSDLYPEMKVTGLVDQYPRHLVEAEIDVPLSWLEQPSWVSACPRMRSSTKWSCWATASPSTATICVVVPTWRSTGDVSIQADIMEEVARMYGYENFEAEPITTTFDGAINQLDKDLERRIKEYLAIRCGMQEIFTYPWMDENPTSTRCCRARRAFCPCPRRRLPPSGSCAPPCCPTCARPW